jgi:hypothetical protein
MEKNNIITAAAIVLFLAGSTHLIRIFYGWELTVNEWEIPIWVSFIGTIIPIFLSYNLLKLRK